MKHLLKLISSLTILSTGILSVSCTNKNIKSKEDNISNNKEDNKDGTKPENSPQDQPQANEPKEEINISEEEKQEVITALEKVFKDQEEAFGTFHTHQEVLDQLKVYIEDNKFKYFDYLTLTEQNDKNKNLVVDENGTLNKIKISFFDMQTIFSPKKVLKDEVVDKYDETKTQLLQVGYKLQTPLKSIKMKQANKKIKKVPKHLPLKINSLDNAFRYIEAASVDNLDKWDTKNIKYLTETFSDTKEFNQDINFWNVSSVIDMSKMFAGASSFNKDLNSWDTSNTLVMNGMFWDAESFNGAISKWKVNKVGDMQSMFSGAAKFNQDLDEWDTSNVENMEGMFSNTKDFNGNISNWNVSNVTSMKQMFQNAKGFRRNLKSWNALKVTQIQNFRKGIEKNIPDQNLPKFTDDVRKVIDK
ncbi:BspA family leucine-rich repeat surface protein [Mycoplasma capricolum subsp. capricolum]|uniref:BspA family leucine-rich repeat surface protein n=1 Tax=Mycoplasma capricolum TaxID=2095 RepID=UPI003DA2D39E